MDYEIWLWTDSKFIDNFKDIKLDYLKINLVNSLENYYIVNKWLSLPFDKWEYDICAAKILQEF